MAGFGRKARVPAALFLRLLLGLLSGVSARLGESLPDSFLFRETDVEETQSKGQNFRWTPESEEAKFADDTLFFSEQFGRGVQASVMHRYAPSSPFRPLGATRQQLIHETMNRDEARISGIQAHVDRKVNRMKSTNNNPTVPSQNKSTNFQDPVVSGLSLGSGEYFVRLSIGTPAKTMYLVIDTGSDLLWLQCAPCKRCYQQDDPIFNPSHSSSYKPLGCRSNLCQSLEVRSCHRSCLYEVNYGDGSFTTGEFSTETVTLSSLSNGGPTTVAAIPIGCGHDNEGYFVGAAGLLGLGKGPLSFPSQVGHSLGRKFSYCFVDRETDTTDSSSLVFGEAAVPAGVKFTPQVHNPAVDTFYYLSLSGISVGGTALAISSEVFQLHSTGMGGVIIDSGTSVTRLVAPAYTAMRDAFRAGAKLPLTAGFSLFDTCFNLSGKASVIVPTVTLHFHGGADMALPASNYLIPVDNANTYCFAFAGTTGLSIIGNIQQQNFRVVYDNENNQVGFVPGQCS